MTMEQFAHLQKHGYIMEQHWSSTPHQHQRPQRPQYIIPVRQQVQEVIVNKYFDKPMTIDAYTQTAIEDFPPPTNLQAILMANKELEERIKAQTDQIDWLKEEMQRAELEEKAKQLTDECPSSTSTSPHLSLNSTTITSTSAIGECARYKILAVATEEADSIDIELSEEALVQNLSTSTESDRLEISTEQDKTNSANGNILIGPHGTMISALEYDKISWTSASLATRKLLLLIFDRDTLATHSMTGKASPAFKGKPVKGQLDPLAIQDIIFCVTKNCSVSQKEVRAVITTKCADENKMKRLREMKGVGPRDTRRQILIEYNN